MKFKARMLETLSMRNLALISGALSKLSKCTILKLSPTKMSFLIYDETCSPKQVMVWCTLHTLQFFNDFSVDGFTDSNEIFLEFPTAMFSSSLSLLRQANTNTKLVELSLTDRVSPCLTLKIEFVSDFSLSRSCVHDIPVRIIPCSEWTQFSEPSEKNYTINLEINNLKKFRCVVDSLKKISHYVTIIGSAESLLSLHAEAQNATVKIIFKNIYHIEVPDNERTEAEVRVDVKKLHQLLFCENLNPKKTVLNILEGKLLHSQLFLESFTFNFYLPVVEE